MRVIWVVQILDAVLNAIIALNKEDPPDLSNGIGNDDGYETKSNDATDGCWILKIASVVETPWVLAQGQLS